MTSDTTAGSDCITSCRRLLGFVAGGRMGLRVCNIPGCPRLQPETRCAEHRRKAERARGTRQARGYDAEYDGEKRRPEYVNATRCGTCGAAFTPENPKTAGHRVAIRKGGRGSGIFPQCRRCNYGWLRTDT